MHDFIRPALKWSAYGVPEGGYLVVAVTAGPNWMDLDDALDAIPGRRPVDSRSARRWHAIPTSQLDALRVMESGHPGRLRIHYAR